MGKKTAIATLLLVLTQYQVLRYTLSTLATTARSDGRVHVVHTDSQGGGVGSFCILSIMF